MLNKDIEAVIYEINMAEFNTKMKIVLPLYCKEIIQRIMTDESTSEEDVLYEDLVLKFYHLSKPNRKKYIDLVCSQTIRNASLADLVKAFDEAENYIVIDGVTNYPELGEFYSRNMGLIDKNGNPDRRIGNFCCIGGFFSMVSGAKCVKDTCYVRQNRLESVLKTPKLLEMYLKIKAAEHSCDGERS